MHKHGDTVWVDSSKISPFDMTFSSYNYVGPATVIGGYRHCKKN